jgi:hypothetical protein
MNSCSERAAMSVTAFHSAADAWFWTISALRARREGAGSTGTSLKRPCEPDDVLCCLDRLYRSRRIELRHALVLREWGERQIAPDTRVRAGKDAQLWREALGSLEGPLRAKGILVAEEHKPKYIGI